MFLIKTNAYISKVNILHVICRVNDLAREWEKRTYSFFNFVHYRYMLVLTNISLLIVTN